MLIRIQSTHINMFILKPYIITYFLNTVNEVDSRTVILLCTTVYLITYVAAQLCKYIRSHTSCLQLKLYGTKELHCKETIHWCLLTLVVLADYFIATACTRWLTWYTCLLCLVLCNIKHHLSSTSYYHASYL